MIVRRIKCEPSTVLNVDNERLRDAVRLAELNLRGMPVLSLHGGQHEQYYKGGIECYYHSQGSGESFFWRISSEGFLYHVETMDDADRSGRVKLFDPVLRILEFSEVFAVTSRSYQQLGGDLEGTTNYSFSWSGIEDRYVAYNGGLGSVSHAVESNRKPSYDNPDIMVTLVWTATQADIMEKVVEATQALFRPLVQDFIIDESTIRQWAEKCLTRSL